MKQKKTVCYFGMSSNIGGIEVFLRQLVPLILEKYNVVMLVIGEEKICFYEELTSMGVKIVNIPSRRKHLVQNYTSLKSFFQNNTIDILHYNASTLSYILPCLLVNRKKTKLIIHAHNSSKSGSKVASILHSINKIIAKRINSTKLAVSPEASEWFFGDKSATVIENGINISRFRFSHDLRNAMRKERNISEEEKIIVNVGSFKFQKNHTFMIKVFHKYYSMYNSKSRLFLIGDGPLKQEIEAEVKQNGLSDSVYFEGNRKNIEDYLCMADVFLFPSTSEGFPISLVEAEASGLHCVISDTISRLAVIDELCSTVSLKADLETWCTAINRTINNDRISFAQSVKEHGFDDASMAKKIIDIYEDEV